MTTSAPQWPGQEGMHDRRAAEQPAPSEATGPVRVVSPAKGAVSRAERSTGSRRWTLPRWPSRLGWSTCRSGGDGSSGCGGRRLVATGSWWCGMRRSGISGRPGGGLGRTCPLRWRSRGISLWRCSRWRLVAGARRSWNGSSARSCGRRLSTVSGGGAGHFRAAGRSSRCDVRRTGPGLPTRSRWFAKACWSGRWPSDSTRVGAAGP